ncbi:MAG TPA: hypothetical protein VLZ12_10140 [Verrucomicrobiae bacterium]|nr:hypothetical protein [Verrucomicrobiae bacterium]
MSANQDKLPPYRGQLAVRTIGTILLTSCALMLVLGLTVLVDRLHGPRFVLYWSWCFLIATAAILVALFDMLMIRRTSRQTRRALFREQLMTKDLVERLRKRGDG